MASEYGLDIEGFLKFTMKQLVAVMECLQVRKHNNHAMSAAMHGCKMDLKQIKKQCIELSNEQMGNMSKAIQAAIRRKVDEKLGTDNG